MPNICKIGFTNKPDKTSHDRAKELSRHTNCPAPFEVVFDIKVKNPYFYEKIIHKKLKNHRINKKREFFECKPEDIIKYFYKNELIKNNVNIDDFPNNYMTLYNIKKIEKVDNKKYNFVFVSSRELLVDIYNIFYFIFRLFISIIYYLYVIIKRINQR
jgi:hypothetical protein